jgi:putative peptide zinc metalloprotease protein
MLPTNRRAIPLRARNDLVAKRIEYRGEGTWVLKDPVGLKYHRLLAEQYCVLRLLDGERSLEELRDEVHREFPAKTFSLLDIQNVVTDLHRKNLLLTNRPGQGDVLLAQERETRRRRLMGALQSLLYLRLPGWDPETTLSGLYPLVRFMFRRWAIALATLFVVSCWVLLAVQFSHFRRALPEFDQFFGWPNLIYLWITLAVAKIIHEFGHGLSCKHFGGECHEMGVMLLVFSPCLYCDVTDSWMLKNKWKRIAISSAGMSIEVIISAAAIVVWWNTTSGLLHHLCLNVFFVTTVTTVIFNANPLMRFDGYYMLSDWLEIPNLRPKADRLLREKFAWHCLGIESRPDPFLPQTGRHWFVLFAIVAGAYRWVVFFGIMLFLYTVLKPYGLQSIGISLAVVSIAGLLFSMGRNVYGLIAAPRAEPMSYRKIVISVSGLAVLIAVGLMVPLPLHVESSFLVGPVEAQHVFIVTPGRLVNVAVEPGQYVKQGTLLARLKNAEKEDARRKLLVEQDVQNARVDLYHAIDDLPREELANVRLRSIVKRLEELDGQLQQLVIVAPEDGWVIAPPYKQQPIRESLGDPLHDWHGTPLDAPNIGCYLYAGTQLLSIAQSPQFQAVILVDQSDRNDIAVGQQVELKFDHLPVNSYFAEVGEISERHLEFAPKELSKNSGGELSTVVDRRGRERLTSSAFQATAILTDDVQLIRVGMQGRARFLIERRSAAMWLWRYLRQTIHFRL